MKRLPPDTAGRILKPLRPLLVLATICLVAYLTRDPVLRAVGEWLDVGEAPRAVDYVLVLPGNEVGRPFVAAALIKAGFAKTALVPQTEMSPEVEDGIYPPPHEIIKRVLHKRGVAAKRIRVLEGSSSSTYSDAQALATHLANEPQQRSVAVVTDGYHTRRSRWIFRRVLGARADSLVFVSVPGDRFTTDNWWQSREGFTAYSLEYGKFIYAMVRYGSVYHWALFMCCVAAAILASKWRRSRQRSSHR